MKLCLMDWQSKEEVMEYRSLPLVVSWRIWDGRNISCHFRDRYDLPIQCAFQILGIMRYFPQENITIKTRLVTKEDIDWTRPWGFYVGLAKDE